MKDLDFVPGHDEDTLVLLGGSVAMVGVISGFFFYMLKLESATLKRNRQVCVSDS